MREIFNMFTLLLIVCAVAMTASVVLPAPDGAAFALILLVSAAVLALIIGSELSEGRINAVGDIMQAIQSRRSRRLAFAAYLLGCSLVAATTVLAYGLIPPITFLPQPLPSTAMIG